MANENEDIKNESTKGDDIMPKKTSLLGALIDKVQDLDTDFPLSGGEEEPRPPRHDDTAATDADIQPEHKDKPEHHQSFIGHVIEEIKHKIDHLDTDFPLSGGEE